MAQTNPGTRLFDCNEGSLTLIGESLGAALRADLARSIRPTLEPTSHPNNHNLLRGCPANGALFAVPIGPTGTTPA